MKARVFVAFFHCLALVPDPDAIQFGLVGAAAQKGQFVFFVRNRHDFFTAMHGMVTDKNVDAFPLENFVFFNAPNVSSTWRRWLIGIDPLRDPGSDNHFGLVLINGLERVQTLDKIGILDGGLSN